MWKYNKEKHSVEEQPIMREPVYHDSNSYKGRYKVHIASLRSIPVPEEYRGITDMYWNGGEDVTGKFGEQYQQKRLSGKDKWEDCPSYVYSTLHVAYRRIVAIPIKQEQPNESEDDIWMQVINVIETCQFMKYKYEDTIFRVKQQFTITTKKENQSQEQPIILIDKWILISDMPPECTVVLGYNKNWIDEDYEPEGIRECFYNDNNWCSAVWNNEQDCWSTDWETKPTHWMQRPQPPKL